MPAWISIWQKREGVHCDNDVARERDFDADGIDYALHSSHNRLSATVAKSERINIPFRPRLHSRFWSEELRHIEARSKIIANGKAQLTQRFSSRSR